METILVGDITRKKAGSKTSFSYMKTTFFLVHDTMRKIKTTIYIYTEVYSL
ncbi:hypothetical protein M670_01569 [Schinkia azotoformans MEV2011]|uniref:Uncharacterized protein n=1 Tax=Schinkia azotoformans MEV2011 TaxID=1348973 RepID=A0A072NQM6_SCHAZ|nr:hypothetical protein M670_01569 [Schinkia azotoformans MEV2011]